MVCVHLKNFVFQITILAVNLYLYSLTLGMASTGEKIDLEKFIDFNDIDKFVNTGTFAMILPEENKKDYVGFSLSLSLSFQLLTMTNFFLLN